MLLLTGGRRMGLVSIAITRATDRKRRLSHVTPLQLRTLPQSYYSERLGFPEGWHMSRGERYLTLSQAKHQHTHGPGGCLRSTLSCTRPRSQATQPDRSQAKVICAGLARHGPSLPHALSSEVAVGWHRLLSQAKHAGTAPRTWAHHRASAEFPRLAVPRHPIACDGRPLRLAAPPSHRAVLAAQRGGHRRTSCGHCPLAGSATAPSEREF